MKPQTTSASTTLHPFFALLTGVIAVSTGAIFARLADAPPLVIAAYRVGLASLVLVPITGWKVRGEIATLSLNDIILSVLAGIFLAFHFATWISSLDYTSVANSVVLVNTNPVWVALLTPFITGDRLRPAAIVSIIVSVTGAFVIGFDDFNTGGKALWGDFLAVVGSICAAFYLLLGRRLRQKLSLGAYISVCYGTAAVVLGTIVVLMKLPITGFNTKTWAAFWAMALFTQLVGHTCYNWALKWLNTNLIAVSLLGEPICSTVLAYFIFDEGLTGMKVIGGVLILFAIYLAAVADRGNL